MQLIVAMAVEKACKHEFPPIPISIFNDDSDLRLANSKADLKTTQALKVPTHTMNKPKLIITDGSAILWIDYVQNVCSYIRQKLAAGNINQVI